MRVEERLKELGIEIPEPSKPGANYVPFVRTGNLVFVTGQLSQWNGERRFVGKLGRTFDLKDGQQGPDGGDGTRGGGQLGLRDPPMGGWTARRIDREEGS